MDVKNGIPPQNTGAVRLAAGVVLAASKDLKRVDPVKSLDALCWWLDDESAGIWLEPLGYDVDSAFIRLLRNHEPTKY